MRYHGKEHETKAQADIGTESKTIKRDGLWDRSRVQIFIHTPKFCLLGFFKLGFARYFQSFYLKPTKQNNLPCAFR